MKLTSLTLSALIIVGGATVCNSAPKKEKIQYYATTDMTWAEFYAGEVNGTPESLKNDGYDAVTSATKKKTKRYTQHVVSEDGSQITGVANVGVGMTAKVYKKLTPAQKARFTFVTDSVFPAYKVLDAQGNFGKYTAEIVKIDTVKTSMNSGGSSTWGNYTVNVDNLSFQDKKVLGVVITDNVGKKYGLLPLESIWLNPGRLAICVEDFEEPRGNHPNWKHTADLQGKMIENITYIMDNGQLWSIDTHLKVKLLCKAKLEYDAAMGNNEIKITIKGLPDGYKISKVRYRLNKKYTYLTPNDFALNDNVLTLKGDFPAATYTAIFESEESADLLFVFDVE